MNHTGANISQTKYGTVLSAIKVLPSSGTPIYMRSKVSRKKDWNVKAWDVIRYCVSPFCPHGIGVKQRRLPAREVEPEFLFSLVDSLKQDKAEAGSRRPPVHLILLHNSFVLSDHTGKFSISVLTREIRLDSPEPGLHQPG
jgi:hypothetical protein